MDNPKTQLAVVGGREIDDAVARANEADDNEGDTTPARQAIRDIGDRYRAAKEALKARKDDLKRQRDIVAQELEVEAQIERECDELGAVIETYGLAVATLDRVDTAPPATPKRASRRKASPKAKPKS